MADPRFFHRAGPFDIATIAATVDGEIARAHDPARRFTNVAPLQSAGPDDLSFLDNGKYLGALERSRAGACLIAGRHASRTPPETIPIVCEDPYLAFALAARLFYPSRQPEPGVSADARVASSAVVGSGTRIEAFAVISPGVEIGARCHIGPGAVLGDNVRLGDDCHVGANATLMCCLVGSRVWIDTGVRVGTQGFGFAPAPGGAVRIPHSGRVIIGDDVEIGANTTIDRGTIGDTEIGDGVMIDNQVQIAHNAKVGRGAILAGQAGLAGSAEIGDHVMLGGKTGVANHVRIGTGTRVGGMSGVAGDLDPGGTYLGVPAIPIRDFWRLQAAIRRLITRDRKS